MANIVAVTGKTPYGTLITHGFTLDEQGRKMSKSIGNTIVPSVITHGGKVNQDGHHSFSPCTDFKQDKKLWPAYGTDVLRMWVASCEYTRDVSLGPSIIGKHFLYNDDKRKY